MKTRWSVLALPLMLATTARALPAMPPWAEDLRAVSALESVFSAHDIIYSCSAFEGRTSALRDVFLSRFSVNERHQDDLAVNAGGSFELRDGSAVGWIAAAKQAWLVNYSVDGVITGEGAFCTDGAGDCSDRFSVAEVNANQGQLRSEAQTLVDVADTIATASAAAPTVSSTGGRLLFTASPEGISYFNVEASELAAARAVEVRGSAASVVAINVSGAVAKLGGTGAIISLQGIGRQHLVLNFATASTLEIDHIVVPATVLAPRAAVRFTEGRLEGGLFAGNLWGNPAGTDFKSTLFDCTKAGGQVTLAPFLGSAP